MRGISVMRIGVCFAIAGLAAVLSIGSAGARASPAKQELPVISTAAQPAPRCEFGAYGFLSDNNYVVITAADEQAQQIRDMATWTAAESKAVCRADAKREKRAMRPQGVAATALPTRFGTRLDRPPNPFPFPVL